MELDWDAWYGGKKGARSNHSRLGWPDSGRPVDNLPVVEMTMFRRIYIDNYKCLVNFELPLQELTLLMGPNGAGKSSVLEVVHSLRQLLRGVMKVTDPGVLPARSLTRWQRRPIQLFEVQVELGGDLLEYRLEVEHEEGTGRARVRYEGLTGDGKPLFFFNMGEVQLYRDDHSEGPSFPGDWSESALARVASRRDNERLTSFLAFIRRVLICGLYPASFATEARGEEEILARDASNFASWFQYVSLERPDLLPPYNAALKEVVAGFRGLRLERVGTDARALMVAFEEEGGQGYELRFDELSDGQRAVIALYGLLHLAVGQGYAILLDEPDNYVALAEIQPWLLNLADACGETLPQALLCSHHPELIDYLGRDRGLLVRRESSGVSVARPFEVRGEPGALKLSELVARGWER